MKVSEFKTWFAIWIDYSNKEWCINVYDFSNEQVEILNNWGVIVNWEAVYSDEQLKKEDIAKYREIEKEAIEKRSEYITAELLPIWAFRDMKLAKLEADRIDIEARYNTIMNYLTTDRKSVV